jgi:acyl carrier protein
VYVLDGHLQPVPVGVSGELYIAGAGVSAGYLNQAEKTAERFVRNPFSSDAQATMYRTGDLARYGADGNIEFLGRGDDQVKIRGFRIELGEIEATLLQHAGVKQAAVLARAAAGGDAQADRRLVAYVVLHRDLGNGVNGNSGITPEALRSHLQQHLPDYMVPQAIVPLPKLPLNANGKLDRQALPEPEQAAAQRTYVAPRTAAERTITEVWGEVLRRDPASIGADDNFFDLGGHSLLATQVVSRLRRTLDIELPLRTLFEAPTVARLASECEKLTGSKMAAVPGIVRVPRNQPLPLSFAQQRLWVLDRIEPNNPLYNIPRAIRLKGNLNIQALTRALNEIVRRHETQRTTFSAGPDGEPIQVIAESLILEIPLRDISGHAPSERESLAHEIAAEEARTPFDLSRGPLLRARILRLAADEHVLLLTMHHIASDAWSSAVFFSELSDLYTAFLQQRPSPLPEIEIQYADYAAWQRNHLQGEVLEEQLNYWREHLRGAPALLQLPSDRPRPEIRKFLGAYESVPIATDIAVAIREFGQRRGLTPFMTMLAAFNGLLSRYSGEQHIVLGTDIANRTTSETERLIGFFINLLPLHTDLSGDPSFEELVERVRSVALGAYAHQDIPFDKLVEDLRPERSLSHNPIVQALFVMQNVPSQRRELPGIQLTPFPASITRSKFDLAVFIRENSTGLFQDWLYSSELFDRSTILRMAENYSTFLSNALKNPDLRLSLVEFRTEAEKKRLEKEQAERKHSQRKKLTAVTPKGISIGSTHEN